MWHVGMHIDYVGKEFSNIPFPHSFGHAIGKTGWGVWEDSGMVDGRGE